MKKTTKLMKTNELCNYDKNPHADKSKPLECHKLSEIPRILKSNFPEKEYVSRKNEKHSAVHWGQRKLLMSEIEFLLNYGEPKNTTVIYAGGAPGDHTTFLSKIFPHIHFILIDPAKFNIKPSPKITIKKEFMTNDLAKQFYDEYKTKKGHNLLFISDVRSVDFRINTLEITEEEIQNDMKMQQDWYKILKPNAGMLKFRLPWIGSWDAPVKTNYLSGDICLPIYGARTTTETRLIVKGDGNKMKNYDNKKYESQMYYFNTEIRNHLFIHNVKAKGLDCCYDCACEVFLLAKYYDKYNKTAKDKDAFVGEMVDTITKEIGMGNRTLEHWEKKTEFKKRVINNKAQQIYYVKDKSMRKSANKQYKTKKNYKIAI
jgi:hypothetical protein